MLGSEYFRSPWFRCWEGRLSFVAFFFCAGFSSSGVGCVSRCVGGGSVLSGVGVTCGSSSLGDPCSELLSFGSSDCHSGISSWVGGVGLVSGGVGEICALGVRVGWGLGG